MLEMRLLGTTLEAYQRELGTYPEVGPDLRPLSEILKSMPVEYRKQLVTKDPWGGSYLYRGNARSYQVVSFGSDRKPDRDYGDGPVGLGALSPITDSIGEDGDLMIFDGRFVQRPFGDRALAFQTINAMNAIFIAASSFAIDNVHYPGDTTEFVPIAELAADLMPIYIQDLPLEDGWGRPLLYFSYGETFIIASFGSDGEQDRSYEIDLPCGLLWYDSVPSPGDSADIVQACGQFMEWPAGTEP